MTLERTPLQAKAEYLLKMGYDVGELYAALWQELAHLHYKWEDFVVVFGTKPSRIQLLNDSAPGFFGTVQTIFWNDLLLSIARMVDAPKTGGQLNLTLPALEAVLSTQSVPMNFSVALADVQKDAKFAVRYRHKILAHRDLAFALGQAAQAQLESSRNQVRKVLASMAGFLNAVAVAFDFMPTHFDSFGGNNGLQLLYSLDAGLKYRSEQEARMKTGQIRPIDFFPSDI